MTITLTAVGRGREGGEKGVGEMLGVHGKASSSFEGLFYFLCPVVTHSAYQGNNTTRTTVDLCCLIFSRSLFWPFKCTSLFNVRVFKRLKTLSLTCTCNFPKSGTCIRVQSVCLCVFYTRKAHTVHVQY